jgi:hypothetical protein
MFEIPLQALPNQQFSVQLDNISFDISIDTTVNAMSATVTRDDVLLVSGLRLVAGTPILPYRYLENGNFFLTTLNDALPFWTEFGVSQFLLFATETELLTIRSGG